MTIPDAKMLIHTVSNKLTAALGYLSLAEENEEKRKEYLTKAHRELKEASSAVKSLMMMIHAATQTAVKVATEATQVAKQATEQLVKATEAADAMADKAREVQAEVEKIVPITQAKKPR